MLGWSRDFQDPFIPGIPGSRISHKIDPGTHQLTNEDTREIKGETKQKQQNRKQKTTPPKIYRYFSSTCQ
jgi:hypothetical protein